MTEPGQPDSATGIRVTGPIRVLVVDDFEQWRREVREELAVDPAIQVVAEAGNGEEAIARCRDSFPDVVLMDVDMPVMDGVQATRVIHEEAPHIRVLMVSVFEEEQTVVEAVKSGASGYVLKAARTDFAGSVHRVFSGEVFFTRSLAETLFNAIGPGRTSSPSVGLTAQEQRILGLFSTGYLRYEDIANRTGMPVGAVRNIVQVILVKLQRMYSKRSLPRAEPERPLLRSTERITIRRPGEPPPLPKEFSIGAKVWLTAVVAVASVALLVIVAGPAANVLQRSDLRFRTWTGRHGVAALRSVARAVDVLRYVWVTRVLRWAAFLVMVSYRRWRHLLIFLGSILLVGAFASLGSLRLVHAGAGLPGFAHPSRPVAALAVTVVGTAYALIPGGRWRRRALVVGGAGVVALALARLYLGLDYPTQVLVAVVAGVATPLLAFRIFAPDVSFPVNYRRGRAAWLDVSGARAKAIKQAVRDQLGLDVADVEPFGLVGAGGSTPLRIRLAGKPEALLFGKLYALSHMRADRWYKFGRLLLYGALEDEKPFNSVRRLVEYEDHMLRYLRDAGILAPKPFGFVEITPDREYLLLTEFLEGSEEIRVVEVDEGVIDEALATVRALWEAGLAHRDIKPSNVLVRDGKPILIDAAFCEIRPSPWRQAVDLANMMLVLALRSTPQSVYAAARKHFTEEEIANAFAATRTVTMPSQLRAMMREDGRDVLGQLRRLAPEQRPIPIQRWTVRRVAVTVQTLVLAGAGGFLLAANIRRTGLL